MKTMDHRRTGRQAPEKPESPRAEAEWENEGGSLRRAARFVCAVVPKQELLDAEVDLAYTHL